MATLMLGTAAVAATATTAAVPATAGLIGAGGAVTAGGLVMGTAVVGGLGLGAVGMIGSANAAAAQAKGQQAMAEYNAKVQEREADAIEQATLYKQRKQTEEATRIASSQLAAMGASGAVSTTGTPLLIQAKQAAESELDNLLIGYEGQIGAGKARSQGQLDLMQAGIYGTSGSNARTAGMIGAGTTLLTGFTKMKTAGYL